MGFKRVGELRSAGGSFTLYEIDSWVLFEELEEGEAEGVGLITEDETAFHATAWWLPTIEISAPTLQTAVERLMAIDRPTAAGEEHPDDAASARKSVAFCRDDQ